MFDSKALKGYPKQNRSKLYLWWIQTPVADFYYDFTHKYITNPIHRLKKLYDWQVNVFNNDYDFDGHCLFAIIEYKLKRVQKCMINGHSVEDPTETKALKLAIKLAGRLKDDKYEEIAHDRFEKKWGELQSWTIPCNDGRGGSYWHSKFLFEQTDGDKNQCREERRNMYIATNNKMKREELWLYMLLHKYLRKWWD